MNLANKKELAKKALGIGKRRIIFTKAGSTEINEAITKNDIRDLVKEGIILIRPVSGRRKVEKRKRKRGPGKIKMTSKRRKQGYVKITRKLRAYVKSLKDSSKITKELYYELRKKIKTRAFKSQAQLKNYLMEIEKIKLDNTNDGKKKVKEKKK